MGPSGRVQEGTGAILMTYSSVRFHINHDIPVNGLSVEKGSVASRRSLESVHFGFFRAETFMFSERMEAISLPEHHFKSTLLIY